MKIRVKKFGRNISRGIAEPAASGPMMSVASIMSSSSSLTPTTPSPGAGTSSAALIESLLQRPSSSSSAGTTPTTRRRETIRQLRERADALRRELDVVVDVTEAAKAATRDAERREREAAAELHAAARTAETQCDKLMELEKELRDKDGRIKMLAAIVDTITRRK